MIDIGYVLKELRIQNGYTQSKLAKLLHVSPTIVYTWESGAKLPSINKLIALAEIYHVSLDYIAGIDKKKSVVLDMTQTQQNFLQTLVLEFQNRAKGHSGLTDRQKDLLSQLIVEFT